MRIASLFLLGTVALALAPLACAEPAEDDNAVTPEPSAEYELRGRSVTEADDGKTVPITEGEDLLVKLSSNPTTGYAWEVVSTDRSFGYPAESTFLANSDAVGSGGIERFTWKTKGALPLQGKHTVKMEYRRSSEKDAAPAKTFSFTVHILAGECPQLSPPAPGFCEDGHIKPKTNEGGCAVGYECEEGCGGSTCGDGQSCQFCWGQFACIPNGAIC